jgi:hypothetical protein
MEKVCILFSLAAYVYHNARFKKRKTIFMPYLPKRAELPERWQHVD